MPTWNRAAAYRSVTLLAAVLALGLVVSPRHGLFARAEPAREGVSASGDDDSMDDLEDRVEVDEEHAEDDTAMEAGEEADDLTIDQDPEGEIRFIPRGFEPPPDRSGGMFGGPEDDVFHHGGVSVQMDEDASARLQTKLGDALQRLIRLSESHEKLGIEVLAAQAEYDAIVESELGEEYWAARIRRAGDSFDKPDPMRPLLDIAEQCVRSMSSAETVSIWEGVERSVDADDISEFARRHEVRSIRGHAFYSKPLVCSGLAAARLTALVVDRKTLAGPGGGKFCGGFHPDLALDYGSVTVLVCFGCRDLRYHTAQASVTFDMTEQSLANFEAFARETFRHRQFGTTDTDESPR